MKTDPDFVYFRGKYYSIFESIKDNNIEYLIESQKSKCSKNKWSGDTKFLIYNKSNKTVTNIGNWKNPKIVFSENDCWNQFIHDYTDGVYERITREEVYDKFGWY